MPSRKESQSAEELLGDDHAALDTLLKALIDALDKANAATVLARLDFFWARLALHIRAEHLHLFPAILERLKEPAQTDQFPRATSTRKTIAQLRADHDFFMHELAAAIKTVRMLKDTAHSEAESHLMDEVRTSISAVSKRLEAHNEVEEKLVYSLPAIVLTPTGRRALVEGIQRELQNLPPRFSDAQPEAHEI